MRVVPAVLFVNSNDDSNTFDPGDGIGIIHPSGRDSDNVLTFREAVNIINAGSTFGYSAAEKSQVVGTLGVNDEIRFDSGFIGPGFITTPVTIGVVNGTYPLNRSVKITGPGEGGLTFDAGLRSRIFAVNVGQNVEISGVTLTSGKDSHGGVIFNSGTLSLSQVTIQNGQATEFGGGIFNNGTLTLAGNTTIQNSSAGTSGGAIANQGTISVNDSNIEANTAVFDGGGIYNIAGEINISISTLSSNRAKNGAGVWNQATLNLLKNTTINENSASVSGGAIENRGTLRVNESTLFTNSAFIAGGGIHNSGGSVIVSNSTLWSNRAVVRGGGINNQAGAVTVINSTFFQNTITNTLALAQAEAGGGAINNLDRLSVIHCTITGNSASPVSQGGAGILTKNTATTRVYNSLVVGNTGFTFDDVKGPLSTDSFGILTTSQTFADVRNSVTANWESVLESETVDGILIPKLRNNGGATKTVLLKASSPAIDQGLAQNTKFANGDAFLVSQNPQDQRVTVFPRNINAPDLGAVESVPEMLVVNSLADDGAGLLLTLREAVALANAIPGNNTITFGVGGTIRLTQGELTLTDLVGTTRIVGPGPNSLAIDGNLTSRIFRVAGTPGNRLPGATAEIAGLTLQNGNAGTGEGGGILAEPGSSLTVSNVTFKNNRAGTDGGGIATGGTLIVGGSTFERNVAGRSGGGIFATNNGEKSVFNCTFLQNVANGAAGSDLTSTDPNAVNGGGGIAIFKAGARIENCTFTGNHAVGVGGGMSVLKPNDEEIDIVHNTLTGNTVGLVPGDPLLLVNRLIKSQLKGGGLFAQEPAQRVGAVRVINTIVVGNFVGNLGPTDYGGPIFDGEFRSFDDSGLSLVGNGMVRDHSVIGGDVSQILAGGLADLGGPTKTIALINNSSNPALGQAAPGRSATDQRGFVRSATAPSIGAFEPGSTTILVTTRTDEDNSTISPNVGTGTSLREAINFANSLSFPTTITFAANMTGVIELTQGVLILSNTQKITLAGPGAVKLTLDGLGRSRILNVKSQAVAEVSGLTFQNGFSLRNGGGAIENIGDLTLKNIVAQFNVVDSNGSSIAALNNGGGAIFNHQDGKLTIENSTFDGNQARISINNNGGGGAAIANDGLLSVVGTTFLNNNANGDEGGGGIANYGTAFVFNSTFFQNVARSTVQGGGAIKNEGNLTLVNRTLTNNFAHAGAGLFTKSFSPQFPAKSTAVNTIISGNLSFLDSNGQRTSKNLGGPTLATGSATNLIDGNVATIFELIPNTTSTIPLLANNGGPTQTVALKTGSPAINAGTDLDTLFASNFSALSLVFPGLTAEKLNALQATDQRGTGFTREFDTRVDIGAFELSSETQFELSAGFLNPVQEIVVPTRQLGYLLRVKNISNVAANNVVVKLELPAGTTFVKYEQISGVEFNITGLTATLKSFPAGLSATFALAVDVLSTVGETLDFKPQITTDTFHKETDLFAPSLPVLALPTVPQFTGISTDNSITQTSVGQQVTYRLTFPTTNSGPLTSKVDPTTITAADFKNAGTAPIRFDSVAVDPNDPASIVVKVTPTSFFGTLDLDLSNTAEIKDSIGRALTLTNPINDTPITVTTPLVVSLPSDEDDGDFSANDLSLREAVKLANQHVGSDTIQFAPNLGPITLTNELLLTDMTGTVSIFGPNGGTQVIQRSRFDVNRFRLFQIATGTSAAFRSLTLANGSTTGNGGAILNLGSLDIDQSTLSFNDAGGHGGAIFNGGGTGQTLGLHRSTLSNNTADRGGAIFNDNGRGNSTLTGELNTISGNSSRSHGGGIANVGTLNLAQTTLVLNRADSDGINGGDGGGLAAFNIETLTGSIIAGNTRGLDTASTNSDIGGGFVNTSSNNVVGDNPTGGAITNGVNGNIVGNNGAGTLPLASILNPTLASNGGPTQTHALVPLSPARDAGATGTLTTDQRGVSLVGAPDIGAFEYQPTNSPIVLTGDTTITVGTGSTVVVNEVLTGSGNLIKSGTGTLVLRGNNTYTGQTTVSGGTLVVGHNNALGTAGGSKGTVVASGASLTIEAGRNIAEALTLSGDGFNNTGALRMNPSSSSLGESQGTSIWSGSIAVANNTRIDVGSNSQLTISGTITPGTGPINQGLTKTGGGRLILAKANTYTGPTTINAGELAINGVQAKSPVVLNGGTLTGVGTTGAVTSQTNPGSRLSPGNNGTNNGVGKLIAKGNLAMNNNTNFDVQINGTTVGTKLDNVDVTGTVTLNNATLSANFVGNIFNSFTSSVGNKYQIITNDGSDKVVGTFNGLDEGAFLTIGSQKFQITYKGGTGNDVVLTHVNTNSAFRDRSITTLVGENGLVTLQGRIVEVDRQDTFHLSINWGDGTATERHTFPAGSDGRLVTLTHQYLRGRATPYEVSLRWLDQHGGGNATKLSVQVSNVAPTAKITGSESINANQPGQFTFRATDPADQATKMRWDIDWGDGTHETLNQASLFTRSHKYSEPGDYLIRATATDRDGLTSAITTFRVHVESTFNPASLLGDLLASGQI